MEGQTIGMNGDLGAKKDEKTEGKRISFVLGQIDIIILKWTIVYVKQWGI